LKYIIISILILINIVSCKSEKSKNMIEEYKAEVIEIERSFARLAKEKGIKTAFLTYASDDAVLLRGEKIIEGKDAISDYFDDQTISEINLEWEPDFVSVSSSGDLAYT